MSTSVDTITSEAMHLPEDQRLVLAHRILASVEPVGDPEVEAAWELEIRERIRRYDAGQSEGIPLAEVFAGLDRKLAQ
ncbi:MAG: addiction module protein [Lacunisphaera sp.]|nr:addiction module protein [Lacunisphaera sp.]